MTIDVEALQADNKRLRDENAALRDQVELCGISQLAVPLRSGRPEHLTVNAAEQHADLLRDKNATVVGKLLVVAVDELRRLRDVASEFEDIRDALREDNERLDALFTWHESRVEQVEPLIAHADLTSDDEAIRFAVTRLRDWERANPKPECD